LGLQGAPEFVKDIVSGKGAFAGQLNGHYEGKVYSFEGEGWETVASAGEKPLVVSKPIGKATAYIYLGELVKDGGAALRPVLAALGEPAAPLKFAPADDYLEYVAYKKGAGAWVALFNHGGIVIGCDRLKPPRLTPPEPLCSTPKGPYTGQIEFRLAKLGLNPKAEFALYEVSGLDSQAFDELISGQQGFSVKEAPCEKGDGVIKARVTFAKRAQYVLAPKGQGEALFFGKP
jgi:hypothetical protein